MPIEPGKYDDMTNEDYHWGRGTDAISKGCLDRIHQSVAHYLARDQHDSNEPALVFGSAFHCAILEPDKFKEGFCIAPDVDRRYKAGKEAWAAFCDESKGKKVISADEYAKIGAMAEEIRKHPMASQLLTNGAAEQSYFWIDPRTGKLCKCRPDYRRHDGIIVDLKSTMDASFNSFQRSVVKYRYYVQAPWYLDGVSVVEGKRQENFVIIAVEKKAPFAVAVYNFDELSLDAGRVAYEADMDRLMDYENSPDKWAGYSKEIQEMYLPSWV